MYPKIVFLGSGTDALVTTKQLRATGGFVIITDRVQFHVDPGVGALLRAIQYEVNPRNTNGIFVSHNHLNHSSDVNAIISAMTLSGMDKHGILVTNQSWADANQNSHYLSLVERHMIMDEGKRIGIEDIDIVALKTKHTDEKTIGFKFIAPEFTLGYSSDTEYFKDIELEYRNCDILILNVKHPKPKKDGNLCVEDAQKIIEKAKPKLAIITHFGNEIVNNTMEFSPISLARDLKDATKIQVIAARDGMTVDIKSYTSVNKQKNLKSF